MNRLRIIPDPDDPNKSVQGEIVRVNNFQDRPSRITLEDGSEITLRITVGEVVFIRDRWDNKGEPIYSVNLNPAIDVSAPEKLRKGR